MISLAIAELLVRDERLRSWSYVVEGQTLRLLMDLVDNDEPASAIGLLTEILEGRHG